MAVSGKKKHLPPCYPMFLGKIRHFGADFHIFKGDPRWGYIFLSLWSNIFAFYAALPDRIERRGK